MRPHLYRGRSQSQLAARHSVARVVSRGRQGEVDADELDAALDGVLERQPAIAAALAKRRLADGTLVLDDVSSSGLDGRCWELAKFGHNRDGKSNK